MCCFYIIRSHIIYNTLSLVRVMLYPVRYHVVCGDLLWYISWSVGWEIEGGYSISRELLHEALCGISVYLMSYTVARLAIARCIL